MRLLQNANWKRLWLECLHFAAFEERRYFGLRHKCRDIVQTAIEKTFSGERTWDPEVCDLAHHLRMTIKSLYYNEFGRNRSHQKYVVLNQAERAPIPSTARAQENLDYLQKAIEILDQHDPQLAEFFLTACRHLTTDCDNDKEAAKAMNIAPSTFTKTKVRISKIIENWRDDFSQELAK